MTLPSDFQFSQGNLQDYLDCRRRFQLRYLERLAWPAFEAEPAGMNEQRLLNGAAFHRLVQQHLLGMPAERLSGLAGGTTDDLPRWWRNYLESAPSLFAQSETLGVEVSLAAPVEGFRLVAKYDAILRIRSESATRLAVIDWKTSQKRPSRNWLAERLQTRVYPYLLVEAGTALNGGQPVQPDLVEMVYWFAGFPREPERFAYNTEQYHQDKVYLAGLVTEIAGLPEGDFPLTPHVERCEYCNYRSLCERGLQAGPLDSMQDVAVEEFEFALDFDQVAEIEF